MNYIRRMTMLSLLVAAATLTLSAQKLDSSSDADAPERAFPDVPGYVSLLTDFHMHTMFSDGDVWPNIRVEEALRHGLDAISITDHVEWLPHQDDVPFEDQNRPYELALEAAKGSDLMVIRGAEITRGMPPGHLNAIFLEDVNKIRVDEPVDAIRAAHEQGAFIFWNHPNWIAQKADGVAELTEMHDTLLKKGLIHGLEVVNGDSYSDEAFQIALDHEITPMGNSDVHGLIDWQYNTDEGGKRPLTIILAEERTEASMKKALFEGRTLVYLENLLIGQEDYLKPMLKEILKVEAVKRMSSYSGPSTVKRVSLANHSDLDLILQNLSAYRLHNHGDVFTIHAHSTLEIKVKTVEELSVFDLKFSVLNALSAPETHPEITLNVKLEE